MDQVCCLMCLIFIEGCRSFIMKINVGLYIKKLFSQLSWGEDCKKKIKEISKTKSMSLFSLCAFMMLSNMRFSLLSLIKRSDWSFCWYWSSIIDNNLKLVGAHSQVVLTRLCLNAIWALYPKIKLTMNQYG